MEDLIPDLRQLAEQKAEIVHQEAELWSLAAAAFANFSEQQARLATHRAHAGPHEIDDVQAIYLSTKQAAEYLGVKPSTLNGWLFSGGGPVYVKMGRSVRYKRDELDDFAAKNTYPHTSAYGIDR